MQLRFTSLAVVSSREDFHLQECAHAGRTREGSRPLKFRFAAAFKDKAAAAARNL